MSRPNQPHPSQRGYFAHYLYEWMQNNSEIYMLTADLGYGMLDSIRDDFPDRFINTGAAEQAMLDVAVGLAYENKIPVCYSITPFLLYRPFETIRTYIDYENLPVKLVGSGRDRDYEHDGISHWAEDVRYFLDPMMNIKEYHPADNEAVVKMLGYMLFNDKPSFMSLKR